MSTKTIAKAKEVLGSTGKLLDGGSSSSKKKDKTPEKKKPEKATKDSIQQLKEREEAVEKAKRALQRTEAEIEKSAETFVVKLKDTDIYKTLAYVNKRKAVDETSCLICATDFSVLHILNDPTMFTTIGHKCLRCAAYCCYKCVYQQTTTNPFCTNSIGYQCGACKFYNFGKTIESTRPPITNSAAFMVIPPSTGYSSMRKVDTKGEPLPTSGFSLQKRSHEENIATQREFVEAQLHAESEEEDDYGFDEEVGTPINFDSLNSEYPIIGGGGGFNNFQPEGEGNERIATAHRVAAALQRHIEREEAGLGTISPQYSANSPQYSPTSPQYSPTSPQYEADYPPTRSPVSGFANWTNPR